ncbi:MAG: ABC transporter permease [Bryobacteraceae bacterium]|nr:ABC transporter permease [Bryobacterales bacterium]MEB2364283.1 ABC transporter permease [Bryobacterales bacterium]NUM99820.1 ABC transporter permease [Bryobacteraceae bacterium]
MRSRIREIVVKELRQALREPRMRALLFFPPVLQLVIFGFAVNLDVNNARIAWFDGDRTPASRELRERFEGSGYFTVLAMPRRDREVRDLLDHGDVQAVVQILPGFARDVDRGRASVQVLVDGTNSNTASLIASYANQIVTSFSQRATQARLDRKLGTSVPTNILPVNTASRVWFNPELRSRTYFVPGVIVNIVMLVTVMLTAMAIVREKEIGTMEQLMVTPIRPVELIIGKTVPFAGIGVVNMIMITLAALLVFQIPFRGSALLLLASTLLFLLTTLGLGLFISTVSHTQQQAMMSTFFLFLPALMLSGFAFPIQNMPAPVQWLTYLIPARYFMEIVRGIFLKGTGFAVLWPAMLALAVLGTVILSLSVMRFHKRLD